MPRIVYSFGEMTATAQTMSAQGDALTTQVEGIWKSIAQAVSQLPSPAQTLVASDTTSAASPDQFLSSMVPIISQLLALRADIATQLAKASAAAQQTEQNNAGGFRHAPGRGPIPS